jgi:hypothetical protein
MNGFGFIEYKDAMDARDVVPGMDSHSLKVEFIITLLQPSTVPTLWVND